MYVCMYVCMHVCMYVCMFICLFICMHGIDVCMHVWILVCIRYKFRISHRRFRMHILFCKKVSATHATFNVPFDHVVRF